MLSHFSGFMPHGHCYLWNPAMVWLQVISNGLIGLSYLAISITLAYLVYRIRDLPFQWMYLAFGLFIITCGFTHFFDVYTIWNPSYWADGVMRAITAAASVGTAVLLPTLIPKAVSLAESAKTSIERGFKLEAAHEEVKALLEKAKELDELKTQFFANVSHELRTPLALILGPAEKMLSTSNLTQEQNRDLSVIVRNAQSVLKHVNDLLDIAKLEAGRLLPSYVELDLSELVRLAASYFEAISKDRGITFSVKVPKSSPAQIDSDMIQRVLLNTLSNAFKFTPVGGRVALSLQKTLDKAILSVEDSGPGIPAQMREMVFERFRQLDGTSSRQFGGTGLGLSITREFVRLHRGEISIHDSTEEGGTLVRIELPLHAPPGIGIRQPGHFDFANNKKAVDVPANPAFQTRAESKFENAGVRLAGGAEKGSVLVVDDNPDMNRFIAEALSTRYQVTTAFDGKEGLEHALSWRPDLIVTDIMMPGMSGDQFIRELRSNPLFDNVPVMVLTAKADDELRIKLLGAGAQDYITKPFSREELLMRARNLTSIKRARDALQQELSSQLRDLEALTQEVTVRRKELQKSTENLRVAKEEAERASQAKSIFLGLVSHEMKTPVTALKLQLELLKRTGGVDGASLTPRQQELIGKLWKSIQRSEILILSILDFIKLHGDRIEPRAEDLDLPAIISELLDPFQEFADEKKIRLTLHPVPRELPSLRSDKFLISVAAKNLIANAVKYTERGSVQVSIAFEKEFYRVSVEDTGPGIPMDQQTRIFEPFQQLQPLNQKHKPGFGIGLTIAKESMKVLGGKIELKSEEGRGSTFTAVFPSMTRS